LIGMDLTAAEFHAAAGVDDWRVLYHLVSAHFRTPAYAAGVALVADIGRIAEGLDRPPRVDLRAGGVTVSLTSRDAGVARQISAAAAARGLRADPTAVQVVNVTLDALAGPAVLPFWQAVLGYTPIGDDYLGDPAGRGPGFGLQIMDAPRPQRNRMHLDVAVPHDQAEARIAAALAAGGRLVSAGHAPRWWTLADPEGNEVCIATWAGR
jgi:4a-hydroxytetrahydrobiopterin dehydratase